jgi:hypothetical protein
MQKPDGILNENILIVILQYVVSLFQLLVSLRIFIAKMSLFIIKQWSDSCKQDLRSMAADALQLREYCIYLTQGKIGERGHYEASLYHTNQFTVFVCAFVCCRMTLEQDNLYQEKMYSNRRLWWKENDSILHQTRPDFLNTIWLLFSNIGFIMHIYN